MVKSPVLYLAELRAQNRLRFHAAIYQRSSMKSIDSIITCAIDRCIVSFNIVGFGEEWIYHEKIPWIGKYPSSRFMGVSSNELCLACINKPSAACKTAEAWST